MPQFNRSSDLEPTSADPSQRSGQARNVGAGVFTFWGPRNARDGFPSNDHHLRFAPPRNLTVILSPVFRAKDPRISSYPSAPRGRGVHAQGASALRFLRTMKRVLRPEHRAQDDSLTSVHRRYDYRERQRKPLFKMWQLHCRPKSRRYKRLDLRRTNKENTLIWLSPIRSIKQ